MLQAGWVPKREWKGLAVRELMHNKDSRTCGLRGTHVTTAWLSGGTGQEPDPDEKSGWHTGARRWMGVLAAQQCGRTGCPPPILVNMAEMVNRSTFCHNKKLTVREGKNLTHKHCCPPREGPFQTQFT